MSGFRDYEVDIYDPTRGTRIASLTAFTTLKYARKVNSYGKMILTIAVRVLPKSILGYIHRIQRDLVIVIKYLGKIELDTIWFVRNVTIDDYTVQFEAFDALQIIERRIILYAVGSAQALKTGAADNVLKAYVRENCGSSAIAARQFPNFSVEADQTLAPTVTKDGAYDVLLPVLQEVALDSAQQTIPVYLAFDVVADSLTTLQFRTYIGQRGIDRRDTSGNPGQRFGPQYGNIVNWNVSYNSKDEITHATAGGQGEGAERSITGYGDTARMAASGYNRIEQFGDCRNVEDINQLANEARSIVRAGRPRTVFTGSIQETRDTRYTIHFGFGDYIPVQTPTDSFDCRLDAISITIEKGQRILEARLWGENV
jgi:hypothetical protein